MVKTRAYISPANQEPCRHHQPEWAVEQEECHLLGGILAANMVGTYPWPACQVAWFNTDLGEDVSFL